LPERGFGSPGSAPEATFFVNPPLSDPPRPRAFVASSSLIDHRLRAVSLRPEIRKKAFHRPRGPSNHRPYRPGPKPDSLR